MCDQQSCQAQWVKWSTRGSIVKAECPCGFAAESSVSADGFPSNLQNAVNGHLGFITLHTGGLAERAHAHA